MTGDDSDRSVLALLSAAVGVYALVVAGATAAVVDAVAACAAWPGCGAAGLALEDPRVLVALGHRALALLVGLLVLWAVASTWRTAGRRTRGGLALALVLYPLQVGLGAAITLRGPSAALAGVHLVAGTGLFVVLVAALAVRLRATAGGTVGDAADLGEPAGSPPPDPTDPTPTGDGPGASTAGAGLLGTVRAYVTLMKPRLMWLLCLVAAAGMVLAVGPALTARTAAATLAGGVLAIGASGTFNHVLERDLDRRMQRTADRPLATDRVGVRRATAFGLALAVASVAIFASVNWLAAALGLAAIAFYSVVYTLVLKPNTVQNTVVGGLAGSFPALIGAVAAAGTVGLPALVLALVIFLWTPAHFYSLALVYREDYARGGVPMFPVVRGEAETRTHIVGYLAATLLAAAALTAVAGLGPLFAAATVGLGAVFLWAVVVLHRRPSRATAWRSFHASNAYLGAILLAVVVDGLVV